MKKLLLLMTLMMPLLFSSCGDDKGDPDFFSKQLIGEWVEVNGPEDELFHIKFDSTLPKMVRPLREQAKLETVSCTFMVIAGTKATISFTQK